MRLKEHNSALFKRYLSTNMHYQLRNNSPTPIVNVLSMFYLLPICLWTHYIAKVWQHYQHQPWPTTCQISFPSIMLRSYELWKLQNTFKKKFDGIVLKQQRKALLLAIGAKQTLQDIGFMSLKLDFIIEIGCVCLGWSWWGIITCGTFG